MAQTAYTAPDKLRGIGTALPFAVSYLLVPVALFSAWAGGWWLFALPLTTWWLFTVLDAILGRFDGNADPDTDDGALFWYRAITLSWFPIQFVLTFGLLAWASHSAHLNAVEKLGLFFGVGVISGTIGIVYAHELMHQKSRAERWMGDLLMASVLYSHFRSEHLLGHHLYVGTPRDPVTARYNEGFHRFFPRVLRECASSAFKLEKAMLARKKLRWSDRSNPFWRYWLLQLGFVFLAVLLGGWWGLALFLFQALVAIWQLELVNYVEHYGLTRKHLGDGKYEPVRPRHSWNSSHMASNWMLINLQRHSDHHYKPARRFPLLQTYSEQEAPNLPFGYPVMTMMALVPPIWRRVMNPRVRKWRAMYYPEITDWMPYKLAKNPMPR